MNAENIRQKYNLPDKNNDMKPISELNISNEKKYFLEHLGKILDDNKQSDKEGIESKFDLLKVYPETDNLQELIKQTDDLKTCLESFRPLDHAHFSKIEKYWLFASLRGKFKKQGFPERIDSCPMCPIPIAEIA